MLNPAISRPLRNALAAMLGLGLLASTAACTQGASAESSRAESNSLQTLTVAASAIPHAEILEFVKPQLKAQGIDLRVKVFTDYVQPNLQVEERQLDANFFQHKPYLDAFNREHGTHLVVVPDSAVHVEPFGAYSKKVHSVAELQDGAVIAVPNDPSNCARSLLLLQKQGLIELKDPTNIFATAHDVVFNPRHLKIRELEAATLPRVLDDVDVALINTNYALAAGLQPTRDALFIEGADSPYANLVAARADNVSSPALRKLVAALRSPATKQFIQDKYHGAVIAVSASAAGPSIAELRIGYQKSSVNLLIARRLGLLERRFPAARIQWVEFSAGPQLLEALGAGSLDFGMTGDTPPIFAQAAGRDVLYVGRETPKPDSSAILVQGTSAIVALPGLRGKRIAFQRGSSAHYLVLRALEKAGLSVSDIQPVYLAPADARAAFERQSVDAWAIWDPYWAAATTGSRARVLTTGVGLSDDVSFYEAAPLLAREHADVILTLFDVLNEADRYVQSHPDESATLLAAATGLDARAAHDYLQRRRDSPVSLLSSAAVADQQAIADTFAKEGILPRRIKVAEAVWQSER